MAFYAKFCECRVFIMHCLDYAMARLLQVADAPNLAEGDASYAISDEGL